MPFNNQLQSIKAICTVGALALAAGAAQAQIEVQVGYADNLRPSPFFPAPWDGGAGVSTFAGAGPSYDAGAIRIINNGASAVTFDAATVDSFGDGSSYSLWGAYSGTSIPAGMSMILTQTASYNFDTSDNEGSNPLAQPEVHLTIDGLTTTLTDTAQVLNTEGTDHLGANNLNESHQWRDIGTFGGQAAPDGGCTLALLGLGLTGLAALRRRQ
jgi:VPDSG-CTERM motif